ncbi:cytochrome b/b6 domain-containing protein [Jiella sp. MQZ9-1]|uniref:Cytochrome b/b6 domain-containing protein n=1 Tax=Jiella flava TaxID=2816857 RepID=A0A939JV50_9HYPH|nr:cytochrome b/b6 domain-containing protein [Jiella flava]MBO0663830.1 cytochrome b/b6 domain-containing protein [Jiella flava]MCD2472403.1 cytochrome b/b6 domain-containing protein [Jiella flava]
MAVSAPRSKGWSTLSVALHWTIVLFILVQFIDHDWMEGMWRAARHGTPVDGSTQTGGWLHIIVGTLVLIAAIVRLWDRFTHGRPPYPENEPRWASLLAKITHVLIYAILILMPITGLIAWFLGVHEFGDIHGLMWTPLLILIVLHVVGAFAQHFWFKTGVLKRILVPGTV